MADERLTLRQAAASLGVSESAIRKRVERGTLRSDKGADGRRYVYLDTGADRVADTGADTSATHEPGALISELRAHNDTLREQLEAERQAHAEARRLLAAALERIPAIEAPTEARESTETVDAEQELDTERARREMAESVLHEGMDEERWRREEAERERDDLRRELFALRHRQRESTETATREPEGGEPRPDAPGPQEGVRRPWWRRVFGG